MSAAVGLAAMFAPPPGRASVPTATTRSSRAEERPLALDERAPDVDASRGSPLRAEGDSARRESVIPSPKPLPPREPPFFLDAESIMVFPPRDRTAPRPVTVMLHGICGHPEGVCELLAEAATERGWLVCPRATQRCAGGGATWSWRETATQVEASVRRVAAAYPGEVDDTLPRTLIGFSLGATRALDVAYEGAGRWANLVLISADVSPDAARLRRAGVVRVVTGAGELDMMRARMEHAAHQLRAAGIGGVFKGLGRIGHTLLSDMNPWLRGAYAWLDADRDAL